MPQAEEIAAPIEACFNAILTERMAGMPILNNTLRVQAVGFHQRDGHWMGVVITPWLMSLMMLPAAPAEWDELELGAKRSIPFPARDYEFVVNEFDGIGRCLTHALYSPMFDFTDQDSAAAMAELALSQLSLETEPAEVSDEEQRIEAYMRKETLFEPEQPPAPAAHAALSEEAISRRDLLFSAFRSG